ncbi:hypothetical protein FH972_026227 [Carpinus fangiana]|uniref:Carrier domain-containing protein n=1 Tax=Carpinus fangiana TaxID=176857 RepID=A0A5N6L3B9_9ROSI|nr:hypothetical protein FH972_026227 [Carpinus fangiana]
MDLLLFGDQTADQSELLRTCLLRKNNAVLVSFLERAGVVLQEEVRALPQLRRQRVPNFLTISNLVDRYFEAGIRLPEIDTALLTISQLSHYLGYFDEHPHEIPNIQETRFVGLCTGLFAAAAVASARSLSELIPIAVETVRIAFRTGTCVGIAKDDLQNADDGSSTWSTIITATPEKLAQGSIDDFHKNNSIPKPSRAYVSAVSTMAVTISGPPQTTKKLFQSSEALKHTHRVPISIYAPFHAAHLFSSSDVDEIIGNTANHMLQQFHPLGAVHSAATGLCYQTDSTYNLMRCIVDEVIRSPVRWDRILEEVVTEITSAKSLTCRITALGNSNVVNSLVTALKSGGQDSILVKDHSSWEETPSGTKGRPQNDKIAIVGMSGRFPDASSHEALWDLLMKGLDVHKEIPADRFDAKAHFDPSGKGRNKSHTPYGCFIPEPGLFDPRFFNMSPREAAQTDPMGRLALVTAYEALEMSGYVPNRTPSTNASRIGTFYGQTSDDWREINAAEDIDTYFITGGVRAFAPGRINYYFKFSGPSFSVDTACSSSTAAIQLACTSLWAGDVDTACAGGMNVLTNPDIFSGLSKGQFLSKTGSCKTYDNDADGYCRGDGVATVILKRYEDAIADKDCILGCILSAGTNHSAEAVSITHPHAGAQEFLYKRVLADAGVDAHDVEYVEMHGTGTQAGDGIEMTSVTNVFAPRHRRRRPDQPLHLGALKANIGHGEASSGISSMIKVLMMMQHNYIPPNVGIKGIMNKSFPTDLQERNVHIPTSQVSIPRHGALKRKFFLNNFSAAGGNTAILMEDPPLRSTPTTTDPRSHHIVTVTARSIFSLKQNIHALAQCLEKDANMMLPSLSYTTTARRLQHNYRVSFTATDISQVRASLLAQIRDTYNPVPTAATPVAFVFTGQGCQYTGIAQSLYQDLSSFKQDIDRLNDLALSQSFPSFLPLVTGTSSVEHLSPVEVQLGLTCIQIALARMWMSWGLKPQCVVGHSLGEYAALHVAGVISASDTIHLVGSRAELLVSKCDEFSHGMLAIRADEETIVNLLGPNMTEIACKNGPEDIVLCGTLEKMTTANEILSAHGTKSTLLKVPFAFHSEQIEAIKDDFETLAASVTFSRPEIPVLSPLTGQVILDTGIIGSSYLARHAREAVDFNAAIVNGRKSGVISEKTTWLEIGAHPVCSGMIRASLSGTVTATPSLRRGESAWKIISGTMCTLHLAGVHINFDEYHRQFNDAHELLVLPVYRFDNKNYWLTYHNNWTLTKGQNTLPTAEHSAKSKTPVYFSTSCHHIVKEKLHANSGLVVFQTNLSDAKLATAMSGHMVNQNPLCPSTLYADQALVAADHLYKQLRPTASQIGLNVCSMEVSKSLVVDFPPPPAGQHMQIEALADLETNEVTVKYRSVSPEGKALVDHAHCRVQYEDLEQWKENWIMTSYLVKNQIETLKKRVATGEAHKVLRNMAYKLFKSFVDYSPPYRGMSEVIFDSQEAEGTAVVKFQSDESLGKYVCAPIWIDSLAHLSGFICNGTDLIDSDRYVYISHGWSSLRLSREFSQEKTYQTYVRMHPRPGNVRAGDVYIFEGDDIVGVVGGLKFQQLERRLMNIMLPPPKGIPSTSVVSAGPSKASTMPTPKVPILATRKISQQATTPNKSEATISSKAMIIVAEECEIDMSELVDDAEFENLGVDSLLSLTISARLREDLDLDIPPNLFVDQPSVRDLKKYLSQFESAAIPDSNSSTSETESDNLETDSDDTLPSTPPSVSDGFNGQELAKNGPSKATNDSIVQCIVAEALGVEVSELAENTDLSEMGLDSLMALTVLSDLREQTGQDLSATFFSDKKTIKDIEVGMGYKPKTTFQEPKLEVYSKSRRPTHREEANETLLDQVNAKLEYPLTNSSEYPKATSVVLQGNIKTARKKLFLFPDGSGSATSYTSIGKVDPDVCVLGLNCPFMKTPRQFTIGITGVSALYLNEVKRRQPEGPYFIGGWSAGGVIAYEVCHQLLSQNQQVEKLILIDSPCPVNLEPLPARLHQFFDEIGLLGTGGKGTSPDWLLLHFESSIKALDEYDPKPLPRGSVPDTFALWATKGVCGEPNDPRPPPSDDEDPKPMKWLLDNRTDFGHNGWGELLRGSIQFDTINANHFTMMTDQFVSYISWVSITQFTLLTLLIGHTDGCYDKKRPWYGIMPPTKITSNSIFVLASPQEPQPHISLSLHMPCSIFRLARPGRTSSLKVELDICSCFRIL